MITDHDLLMRYVDEHREALRRDMEQSRAFLPRILVRKPRRPMWAVVVPLRPWRKEA